MMTILVDDSDGDVNAHDDDYCCDESRKTCSQLFEVQERPLHY